MASGDVIAALQGSSPSSLAQSAHKHTESCRVLGEHQGVHAALGESQALHLVCRHLRHSLRHLQPQSRLVLSMVCDRRHGDRHGKFLAHYRPRRELVATIFLCHKFALEHQPDDPRLYGNSTSQHSGEDLLSLGAHDGLGDCYDFDGLGELRNDRREVAHRRENQAVHVVAALLPSGECRPRTCNDREYAGEGTPQGEVASAIA
mmetsp:Transcript_51885/g.123481  ORF Transcript_51885/g.123481 Transcript_51885/m.123481 type:complete len:204 (+) Transcript_51885:104-715(+)